MQRGVVKHIEYGAEKGSYTVASLIEDLQHMVDNNRDIDFRYVPVSLNDEYSCSSFRVQQIYEGDFFLDIF
jgi:hypothetical protein